MWISRNGVEEIAAILGIARSTLFDRKADDPAIEDAIERGRDIGRSTLRRLQWDKAQQGSDTMLIWLGKQMLGQRDNTTVSMTGPGGTGPVHSVTAKVAITDPIEAARAYQRFMAEDWLLRGVRHANPSGSLLDEHLPDTALAVWGAPRQSQRQPPR